MRRAKRPLIERLREKGARNAVRIALQIGRDQIVSFLYVLWLRALGARIGRACCFRGRLELKGDPRRILIGDRVLFRGDVCLWTHDDGPGHGRIEIGDQVALGHRMTINSYERITIGPGCMFGDSCYIQDNDHGTEPGIRILDQPSHGAGITIGADVWFGAFVIALKGVSVGDHSVVGAGSVVVKSIPAGVIAVGVPCRPIRRRDGRSLDRAA